MPNDEDKKAKDLRKLRQSEALQRHLQEVERNRQEWAQMERPEEARRAKQNEQAAAGRRNSPRRTSRLRVRRLRQAFPEEARRERIQRLIEVQGELKRLAGELLPSMTSSKKEVLMKLLGEKAEPLSEEKRFDPDMVKKIAAEREIFKEVEQQRLVDSAAAERLRAEHAEDECRYLRHPPISHQALTQGNIFVRLCRAVSIISGGFLLGSTLSHGNILFSILGTGVGVIAFTSNEVFIRRTRREA